MLTDGIGLGIWACNVSLGGGVVLDFPTLASSAILQAGITFLTLVALVPGSEILHLLI